MKKLIFFDIDGTLLDHDKKLPVSTKEAIETLREIGHDVAIATGRAPYHFKEIREELGINTYVCFNGQCSVVEGNEIYKNPISSESLELFTEMAARKNHPIIYMDMEQMRTNVESSSLIGECMATLGVEQPEYDPDFFKGKEIFQSLLFCGEIHELQYQEHLTDLQFIRWHTHSMDVLPSGGSKAKGIEQIISRLGFEKRDVYAFGDNLNDIEMLQFVGNGIAMGNAPKKVKEAAKFVTSDVADNGIAQGLKLVGLL